jgi:hypothetical protein
MTLTGGCYCGALRYEAEGEPIMRAQCHCRECQYITGGGPNFFVGMPIPGFRYVKGAPATFKRGDIANPVTREFCATCGTHVVTRPAFPLLVLKAGTLDDPKQFGMPQSAIYMCDAQPFHSVPEGVRQFDKLPG